MTENHKFCKAIILQLKKVKKKYLLKGKKDVNFFLSFFFFLAVLSDMWDLSFLTKD